MELLKTLDRLHDEDKHREAVELIQSQENFLQNPELVSILARCYNNLSNYKKAAALLLSVEETEGEKANWNYRLGYSYLYLEKNSKAIEHLTKAIEIDESFKEDCEELLNICYEDFKLPSFNKDFHERVELFYEEFAKIEEEVRRMLDKNTVGEEVLRKVETAIDVLCDEVYFEVGKSDKCEIIFSLEGAFHRAHIYEYIADRMPEGIKENWRFVVGKFSRAGYEIQMHDQRVNADEIMLELTKSENGVLIAMHCDKLDELMKQDANQASTILIIMLENVLGEICCSKVLDGLTFKDELLNPIKLSELPKALTEMDIDISNDPKRITEGYLVYEIEPNYEENAPDRSDVFVGSTSCEALIADYLGGRNDIVDDFHSLGVVAGHLFYNNDAHEGKNEKAVEYRSELQEEIEKVASQYGKFIGGAMGSEFCYLDFLAYDIRAFLKAAIEVFERNGVEIMVYGPLRRGVDGIRFV